MEVLIEKKAVFFDKDDFQTLTNELSNFSYCLSLYIENNPFTKEVCHIIFEDEFLNLLSITNIK